MTREPRSRPLPDWLRDLPAAVAADLPKMTNSADYGPNAQWMLAAGSALMTLASTQAERLPFPGPWTMMLDTIIRQDGDGPWAADEGPHADRLAPGWLLSLARDIDDTARDRATIQDCRNALRHVTGFARAQIKPLAEPFARATTAGAFAVALLRRAVQPEESARRLENLLAIYHACDLRFWEVNGGWPWKPLRISPRAMFMAREIAAHAMGETTTMAGRA